MASNRTISTAAVDAYGPKPTRQLRRQMSAVALKADMPLTSPAPMGIKAPLPQVRLVDLAPTAKQLEVQGEILQQKYRAGITRMRIADLPESAHGYGRQDVADH